MPKQNPLLELTRFGQSIWLDYIQRGFIESGELAKVIAEDAVTGLTSNPAIFHKAILDDAQYNAAITRFVRDGLAAHEIYEALVIDDIRCAADALASVYRQTQGRDGFVSLEVSPHFARDAEGTYWEAKRLAALVDRDNLLVKVPGTIEGVDAVRRLIADGLNINITLLFGVERYAAVADAYLQGLEERIACGQPIERIASVASFFISRIDTLVDQRIDALSDPDARALRGECAVAFARLAYEHYRAQIEGRRWRSLAEHGAQLQRLLWASTGTKDPAYSDVKYVDALIGPDTVTTLPVETLIAYRDHGDPALRLYDPIDGNGLYGADDVVRRLAAAGVDPASIAAELEEDGIRKFVQPLEATLAELRKRIAGGVKTSGGGEVKT